MTELEDKATTLLMLLSNATGAEFEDEEMAIQIIVETLKSVKPKKKRVAVVGFGTNVNMDSLFVDHIPLIAPPIPYNKDENRIQNKTNIGDLLVTNKFTEFTDAKGSKNHK